MGQVNGTFIYNGEPRNGATAKLWASSVFSGTPPEFDDAEPGSGQTGLTISTAQKYGGDGAYRWTGVDNGEYYVSCEYLGHRTWQYYKVESIEGLLTTKGDMIYRDSSGLQRLPIGSDGQSLVISSGLPAWVTLGNGWYACEQLLNSNDTEKATTSSSYTKLKETKINEGYTGSIRVKFDLKINPGGADYAYGRVYRNGVAVGAEHSTSSGTYTTYYDDLIASWSQDDLIQVYVKALSGAANATIRNFRFYYGRVIEGIKIPVTNQDP